MKHPIEGAHSVQEGRPVITAEELVAMKAQAIRDGVTKMTITDKQFDQLAQNAHVLGGAVAVLLAHLYWGADGALVGAGVGVAMAAAKEFIWDEINEDPEVRGSSLRDFAFYCIGIVAGLVAVAIGQAVKLWP